MKKIIAALSGAAMFFSLVFFMPTAAADTNSARADWGNYALSELSNMEQWRQSGQTDNYTAWTNAYQAELTAFKYGTWNNPETLALLNNVYAAKKATGGYGLEAPTDAFQDGTNNSTGTTYTVTTADHVGETLLEGYKQGVVPVSEVYSVVDALMNQPIIGTGQGKCMLYSNSPNDTNWCVINVSAGAAAFLQKALDAGISRSGQQALIDSLKPFITWSYERGVEELSIDSSGNKTTIIKHGFWPYAYEKTTGTWRFSREGRAQDWNHNAYTSESAITLGLPSGMDSATDMLDMPNYRSPRIDPKTLERLVTDAREVEGRMRIQGILPDYRPTNMWQDATFYSDNYTDRALTDYAQAGRWAARMAGNANADSVTPKVAEFLSTPKSYIGSTLYTGNPSTVPAGSKIVLRSDVREYTGLTDQYRKYAMIVKKPVVLKANGVVVETKTSGIDGNIAFVYTINKNTCFEFSVVGEASANQKCVNVK